MASKYVTDTAAAKSLSAYVILNKKGEHIATVRAHFSNGGTCLVNVTQHGDAAEKSRAAYVKRHGQEPKTDKYESPMGFQRATAGGYGYDKFTAALSGMIIDGHVMSNHCSTEGQPKKPKGARLYPRDFKAPKGWTLANWTRVSRATGVSFYRDHWQTLALEKVGRANYEGMTDSELASVARIANELSLEWEFSDDCESGYISCHRESGLDYLKALGYRVIQPL